MTIKLEASERLDDLDLDGLSIIQSPEKFCFGIDAVLLSSFAKAKKGHKILDLGTGTGIIPILLSAKTEASSISALEIQAESADMARRSVAYNKLESKINIVTGDIKEASTIFGHASFDVITCNPPYMIGGHGLQSGEDAKMIARHEVLCEFEDIARESTRILKQGGTLYLVHRPFRLVELLVVLSSHKLEPKRIRFVHPYVDKEPTMVLIEAKKGAKSRVTIDKPLIVYESPGEYTEEIKKIYYEKQNC